MFTSNLKSKNILIALALVFVIVISGILPVQATATIYALIDSPGSLDATFDGDGLVTTPIGIYHDEARAVAVQADGKIVVAGGFTDNFGYHDFFVIRYNDDGSLDTSFAGDGIVTTDFGGDDVARALAIQEDRRIVVAGYTSPDGSAADFALARYNANGSLDTSFDSDGKLTTSLGNGYDYPSGVAVQSDGKIIVVGDKYIGPNNYDIAILRYNPSGSLDTTFDSDGIVTTSIGSGDDYGGSVVIQQDGKIVVGATTYNNISRTDFALLMYNNDGSLDPSFDSDGIVTKDFGIGIKYDDGGHVAIQPDGQIIIAGNNRDGFFLLARYNQDGSLDTTFDADGLVATQIGSSVESVRDIALQTNGKIVLAGYAGVDNDFALMRYNRDGSVDTDFGVEGRVLTDFGISQDDLANSVAIQSDGKIVAAGYRYIGGSDYNVALARYIGDDPNATLVVTKTADTNDGVCDSDCSLREAIDVVSEGGTITFDPSLSGQTITLQSTLDINKNLTIDGSALPSKLSISGNNSVRVFLMNPGVTATIDSLIIKNGKSTSNGGGVYNNGGTLTVINSVFSGNRADFDPNVVGYGYGGAIYSSTGVLTVTGSTFSGNNGSRGGAIGCSGGTMTVTNSTFSTNTASSVGGDGGAIHDNCGTSIANTIFTSNSASHNGGAIFTDNDIDPLTVTNSTFYGNTATAGGGIANYGGLIVNNSTFSNNNSSNGGAIRDGLGGVLSLRNSILANTVGGVDCIKSESAIIAANVNNLIETTGTDIDFESCGISLLSSDPMLGALADNGGFTQTMALLPGSPAINAGDDETCSITDQRGVLRPQGSHCDIGAYEYQESFIPTFTPTPFPLMTALPKVPTPRPFIKSQMLTHASLTTQYGTTSGSLSSLGLLDQNGADDNPAAYVSFQTPGSSYLGYRSFYLPNDTHSKLISTMLLQVNFKGPASSSQTWAWSIYDWSTKQWIKLGDTIGVNANQWQTLLFRIRYPWRYSSPVGEIRIQLKSNNANGDVKIDYEAIHITYLSISATPTPVVVPAVTPHRPGISSAPTATPSPTLNP